MVPDIGFPALDLAVFVGLAVAMFGIDYWAHRDDKPVKLATACMWTVFWIATGLLFAVYLGYRHGSEIATMYVAGYVLEKTLSVDNLFVIMMVFKWFKIPDGLRHRVLYYGILGAIVFRGVFVGIGSWLFSLGPIVEVLFGAVVLYCAFKMLFGKGDDNENEINDYSEHVAFKLVRRFYPVWPRLSGHNFFLNPKEAAYEYNLLGFSQVGFVLKKGATYATPLLLCLAVIELSDVMFAFDSVPAVIAVSREPLIVYSAMMFAILGLRSLYFVLEALRQYLVHLEKAVIVLMFFIGAKLLLGAAKHWGYGFEIDPTTSLYIVLVILACGIVASFIWPAPKVVAVKPDPYADYQSLVGLGWDPSTDPARVYDLDLSILLLDENQQALHSGFVYHGKPDYGQFAHHTGDNTDGQGDGDDEAVLLNMDATPATANRIRVLVNFAHDYVVGHFAPNWTDLQNAFVRVVIDGAEIHRIDLSKLNPAAGELYAYVDLVRGGQTEGSDVWTVEELNELYTETPENYVSNYGALAVQH